MEKKGELFNVNRGKRREAGPRGAKAPQKNAPEENEGECQLKSRGSRKVKLLLAVSHTCSVTTGVNPAHALIPRRCAPASPCPCVCVCARTLGEMQRRGSSFITFLRSLSGLKVPNHDCICAKRKRAEEKVKEIGFSEENNRILI